MRRAQVIGISVAVGAGLLAFVGMKTLVKPPPPQIIESKSVETTKVLVARSDIGLGQLTTSGNFYWAEWPSNAINPNFITYNKNPRAKVEMAGAVARTPILKDEPITSLKLIQAGKGGVLAAILPAGKRAISTRITEQSAVGKMILPNDHVDVILTQRKRGKNGNEQHIATTLFRNVRVLAIGQQIEAKDGRKDAQGNVATLELTQKQAERLALANSAGEISLALRSIADITTTKEGDSEDKKGYTSTVKVTRYGTTSREFALH